MELCDTIKPGKEYTATIKGKGRSLDANAYMNQFCAGAWEHCTIARHLTAEYERQEEKNGE